MPRVTAPPHGSNWRVSSKGYVEGAFIVDGKRFFRNLGRLDVLLKASSGKRRTEKALNAAIQPLWDAKRDELLEAMPPAPGETVPMSEVFKEWIKDGNGADLNVKTIRTREKLRDYYKRLVGDHPVEEFLPDVQRLAYDPKRASAFRAGLREMKVLRGKTQVKLSAARINTYLGLLSSTLNFAVERFWLGRAPRIEKVKERAPLVRIPKPEHVKAIRKRLVGLCRQAKHPRELAFYKMHRLLFYLLFFTGVRGGEAINILRGNVFLDRRWILLEQTKTGDPRLVRFGPFLRGKLRAHMAATEGKYLFAHPHDAIRPAWKSVAEASQAMRRHIEDAGHKGAFKALHGYRAGFATLGLNDLSIPGEAIRPQLGHKDLSTTLEYYVSRMDVAQAGAIDSMERELRRALVGGELEGTQKLPNAIN